MVIRIVLVGTLECRLCHFALALRQSCELISSNLPVRPSVNLSPSNRYLDSASPGASALAAPLPCLNGARFSWIRPLNGPVV